jgi:hypothetical protein
MVYMGVTSQAAKGLDQSKHFNIYPSVISLARVSCDVTHGKKMQVALWEKSPLSPAGGI